MSVSRLVLLPEEILDGVCAVLHRDDRSSLRFLAQVNRICNKHAMHYIYRDISFTGLNQDEIQTFVARCIKDLAVIGYNYTRRVEIYSSKSITSTSSAKRVGVLKHTIFHDSRVSGLVDMNHAKQPRTEEDRAIWEPMVRLLSKLAHVTDFYFRCGPDHFPLPMLHAIHSFHPQCRITIGGSVFPRLEDGALHRDLVEFLASPCLYSLTTQYAYEYLDRGGGLDYSLAIAQQALSGSLPNIKHFKAIACLGTWPPNAVVPDEDENPVWQRLRSRSHHHRPAKLEFLDLTGSYRALTAKRLQAWFNSISLRDLTSLKLMQSIEYDTMVALANDYEFPNLRSLTMHLPSTRNGMYEADYETSIGITDEDREYGLRRNNSYDASPASDIATAGAQFLTSLPHLTTLELSGCVSPQLVKVVADGWFMNLRTLYMAARLECEGIHKLSENCPMLEDLAVEVQRTKFDAAEIKTYKAFSHINRLGRLSLILKCGQELDLSSGVAASDPLFDDFDDQVYDSHSRNNQVNSRKIRNGHVKDALINCAIDEDLAGSIWDAVSSPSLNDLRLYPTGGLENFKILELDGGPLISRIRHMRRSFIVERSRGETKGILVEELRRKRREEQDKRNAAWEAQVAESGHGPVYQAINEVFERIWPRKQTSPTWRDDWHSFSF